MGMQRTYLSETGVIEDIKNKMSVFYRCNPTITVGEALDSLKNNMQMGLTDGCVVLLFGTQFCIYDAFDDDTKKQLVKDYLPNEYLLQD